MDAVALTDHGVLYGAVEFFKKARKEDVKPIIGCEVYMARDRMDQFRPKVDDKRFHLVLLVRNEKGYRNLVKLVSEAHLRGFYYKPRIDEELLKEHAEGLICLSGCLQGKIPRLILEGNIEEAEKKALEYRDIFGPENFYLELQHHPNIPEQEKVNKVLVKIAQKHRIPLVATNDVHYLRKEDAKIQDTLMLINTGADPNDPDRLTLLGDDFSMRSPDEMWQTFSWVPEALENTLKIAESVEFEFDFSKLHFPRFEIPGGMDANTYLRKLVYEGVKERYPQEPSHLRERIEYELSVIEKLGFAPYFLIVRDIILWAKQNRIVVGPGRGSAAGSVVAYLLKITSIDPLKHNLLFERFLNEGRISFPDIDIDFQDNRRDEVIRYTEQKYGKDKVAHIITFGTMASRAVVRDVGRALGYSYGYCDKIAKLIPPQMSLKEAIDKVKDLQQMYVQDEKARILFDTAVKIEGRARHVSTHAAGIVITPFPLTELIPLQYTTARGKEGKSITTQYEMKAVEDLGVLKMDFLGLRNLTTIKFALELIEERHGKRIDLSEIPIDDEKTFKLYQEGSTEATFQFNSEAMQKYLRKLHPTTFEDLVAMIALYRPGPMKFIEEFIARKHGKKKIEYLHPDLKEILKETYGIVVYQEQLMAISRRIAGFSPEEADTLRKAVGKKIKELLLEQEKKFIEGAVRQGYAEDLAKKLWNWILPFASYGFNKSHSVAYAVTAYHTGYLKANYPLEYMAAVLMTERGDIDKMAVLLQECQRLGIKVLPPDINRSQRTFAIDGENQIRFGLESIKNVGESVVSAILAEREKGGEFRDIFEFVKRVGTDKLNRKAMECLIKSGAMDSLGERKNLLFNLERILDWARKRQKQGNGAQMSLFGTQEDKPRLEETKPASQRERLLWEKELLGLFVSSHPMKDLAQTFKDKITPLKKIIESASHYGENIRVKTAGVISGIKRVVTRNGSSMLFVTLEDHTGLIELVAFPSVIEQNPLAFQENKIVLVEGVVKNRFGELKLVCEKIEEVVEE